MWDWLSATLDFGVLQTSDKVGLITALVTGLGFLVAVPALIFTAWSARAAARSANEAARQMELSREALRAQTLLSVMSYEREIKFSAKMDVVRALQKEMTYHALSPTQRDDIRAVVDFLNHIGHLIRYGYVSPRQMLLLYTPSIEACREVLIERIHWLDEIRQQAHNPKLYLHFESLCKRETQRILWGNGEATFTGDIYQPPKSLVQNS
jgi:hypothetical protein